MLPMNPTRPGGVIALATVSTCAANHRDTGDSPVTPERDLIFRKDLCFYQMVSAAAVSFSSYPFLFGSDNPANLKPLDHIALPGIATGDRHFRPYDVHREAIAGNVSKNDFLGTICMMRANTAYESVRDANDRSPEFELFRHVRNASSHLNRFYFRGDEPRRPASWRGVSINYQLKGNANPLQNDHCFGKMLGTADVFLLLWDIEQIIVRQRGEV
jgi:hypothetical protein